SPSFLSLLRPSHTFSLFPYTTLFRSVVSISALAAACSSGDAKSKDTTQAPATVAVSPVAAIEQPIARFIRVTGTLTAEEQADVRSEEHTSELQSLTNLVCRLLLEKKK